MTDQPKETTRRTYAPIPTDGETYLIVDRTPHTQNVSEVNGTFEAASRAAEERAAGMREAREVFVFKKVAVCRNKPAVMPLFGDQCEGES